MESVFEITSHFQPTLRHRSMLERACNISARKCCSPSEYGGQNSTSYILRTLIAQEVLCQNKFLDPILRTLFHSQLFTPNFTNIFMLKQYKIVTIKKFKDTTYFHDPIVSYAIGVRTVRTYLNH